jgi:hypothetical protein
MHKTNYKYNYSLRFQIILLFNWRLGFNIVLKENSPKIKFNFTI